MDSEIKTQAERELAALGVRLVVLYGSRVNGTARDDSDYDVAVLFGTDSHDSYIERYSKTLEVVARLAGASEDEIDLTELRRANPLLLKQVTDNGRVLYGSEKDFLALKLKAFHKYIDYAPYFRLEREVNRTAYAS